MAFVLKETSLKFVTFDLLPWNIFLTVIHVRLSTNDVSEHNIRNNVILWYQCMFRSACISVQSVLGLLASSSEIM